jgi:hypothetical protein
MSVGATGVGEEQGNEDFFRTSDRWSWSGARDRRDKVAPEREASALWSPLLRRLSTAAVGAGRLGIGSHSVAILVERPVSLTEHDCLAPGAAYNGW